MVDCDFCLSELTWKDSDVITTGVLPRRESSEVWVLVLVLTLDKLEVGGRDKI